MRPETPDRNAPKSSFSPPETSKVTQGEKTKNNHNNTTETQLFPELQRFGERKEIRTFLLSASFFYVNHTCFYRPLQAKNGVFAIFLKNLKVGKKEA